MIASCPSFTDLRRFAADAAAGERRPHAAGDDAFLAARRWLFEGPGTELGAIDLPAGEGRVPALAADEFVIACDGAVTLQHAGGELVLPEGASAVLAAGTAFAWCAQRPATLVYLRHTRAGAPAAARLQPIDETAALQPSGAPLAELLLGPTPNCRNHTDFRSSDGEFTCGTWDSTPYRRKAMLYGHTELMYLLEGSVTLEDDAGRRHTFERHDLFVVAQGARCSWHSSEQVKKVYAIVRPA